MKFDLKVPCGNCPFVEENEFILSPERIREIGEASSFSCHKTTDGETDAETGEYHHTGNEQHCFGHLVVQWEEFNGFNTIAALAAQMDMFDPNELPSALEAGCYDSFEDYAECMADRGM